MGADGVAEVLAAAGLRACRAAREAVYATPLGERARLGASTLKPEVGELARQIDRIAEAAALEEIECSSAAIGHRIELIVDPATGRTHTIGSAARREVVFAAMDAVDGTIKLGGIGNDLERGRIRAAGDGAWAAGLAFTLPTAAALEELSLADFRAAAIVDGNPTRRATYPQEVLTLPGPHGLATFDVTGVSPEDAAGRMARRVFTTSNATLSRSMAYLDSFQAFDRATRAPRDEALATEIYRGLIDRHGGGAFDVLRQYANLSALLRVMLGWREEPLWFEAQGAAFLVVNENLFNLVPAVAVIAGAGGLSVDFDGKPLAGRRLGSGRANVIHAANPEILKAVLAVVAEARRRADTPAR
jgi:hypothetical protein